jgi:hypothetical protein
VISPRFLPNTAVCSPGGTGTVENEWLDPGGSHAEGSAILSWCNCLWLLKKSIFFKPGNWGIENA